MSPGSARPQIRLIQPQRRDCHPTCSLARDVLVLLLVILIFWKVWSLPSQQQTVSAVLDEMNAYRQLYQEVAALRLPIRLLVEDPECADKFIQSMGIHNVTIAWAPIQDVTNQSAR